MVLLRAGLIDNYVSRTGPVTQSPYFRIRLNAGALGQASRGGPYLLGEVTEPNILGVVAFGGHVVWPRAAKGIHGICEYASA